MAESLAARPSSRVIQNLAAADLREVRAGLKAACSTTIQKVTVREEVMNVTYVLLKRICTIWHLIDQVCTWVDLLRHEGVLANSRHFFQFAHRQIVIVYELMLLFKFSIDVLRETVDYAGLAVVHDDIWEFTLLRILAFHTGLWWKLCMLTVRLRPSCR